MGLPKTGLEKRMREYACEHTKDTPKTEKPNSPLCAPVCDFESRVGERHHRSPKPAPLEQCEPFVTSSCHRQLPEKSSDTKYPSFPAEKHRASLQENSNKPKTGDVQPLPL